MYFNIKLCRCQLQLHQNIDKKLVYQILKSPAIQMITGLNFNIQMIYSSKKGRVKGRVLIDLYYNVMNFKNSKIA
ncbi:FanG protein [Streptococcus dysgalactiae subsp. dysgalactiae]|uniref:FanG protein n=1 Tax=Streptococcus dysgalactiae TaxID=1334 RepID=UPI0009B66316|nr:FanG protein [Streptococcus dysgalactiae]MCY7218934.1 FanG protein [Streptococcus dysgalactiae]MCY7228968.1 FanG protein [Streptococcus dysgalactiae]QGG99124.1 FanG protein [Streptococcus dysgalactiae subsp. dysgalactiae]TYL00122.1 FanG protein [Streptococcus dysgalactiae]